TVYFDFGQNLVDMTNKAEAEQRWDLLGVAQVLKAWGWLQLTSVNGEIIIKEAVDASKTTFNYDTQEFAYQEVFRLLNLAITNLARTDGAVNTAYLAKTDIIYKGNRALWTKFAYGLKAMALNHFSNKTGIYKPDEVITAVDLSFAGNADDPLLAYTGTANDDINYLAGARNNITSVRQTRFALGLMDGTQFLGAVDPRLSRMLAPSPDGVYRGIDPVTGVTGYTTAQLPNNLWGYTTQPAAVRTPARYIFSTKSKIPVISYAQLQFVKAEAAYKKGDKGTALLAYKNGISASIDFVNARNTDDGQVPTQITSSEKSTFLASTAIVPVNANDLSLSQIMCQKFIAQWGWGHLE
ncbi:MAG: SusD/RagB family nutrient-binding outer membrane lipoprotein, partial [Pedobacter sp.]